MNPELRGGWASGADHSPSRWVAPLAVALVGVGCFKIIAPFLGAILWAIIIVVATWPIYQRLSERLGQRPRLATALMTLSLATIVVGPVALLTVSLTEHVRSVVEVLQDLTRLKLPEHAPALLADLPVIGSRIDGWWHQANEDVQGLVEWLRPQVSAAAEWVLSQGANLGLAILEFLLALLICVFLYGNGADAARWLRRLAFRLGGGGALPSVEIAGATIRSVSQGVVGTAVIQAVLSGLGFALADVPGPMLLGFFCLFTAMLQIGTGVVWVPVAIWLSYEDHHAWAVFTVVWGILVNTLDNFIKPYLISRGSGLPFVLILMGVIGGLLAWGFIGIFLGPTMLATGYTLLTDWLSRSGTDPVGSC